MNSRTSCRAFAAVFVVAAAAATPATTQQGDPAAQAAREVVEAFQTALETGDAETVIVLLHPDVRIYEGGHAETREEYQSGHLRGDIAFLQAVESETMWDQLLVDGGIALYMSQDRKTGTYRDREIDSSGTETIVLVMTEDGWRIRHIHWSSR